MRLRIAIACLVLAVIGGVGTINGWAYPASGYVLTLGCAGLLAVGVYSIRKALWGRAF